MALPDMQTPQGEHQTKELRYFDGNSRTVHWTDVEVPYPDGQLIVSRTDLQGVITHANEAFVIMSGYERGDLIGAPQYILRHPEMPSRCYQSLWADVQAQKKWQGYIKNLRKDGSYYWVYATVIPNIRNGKIAGYTSVRRKPSNNRIQEIIPVYRQWIEEDGAKS